MEQSMERWSDLVMQPRVDPGAIVHRHVSMSHGHTHQLELTVPCDPADVNESAAQALISPAPVEIDYDAVARLNMIEGLRGDTFDTSIAAHDEFVERVSSIVKRPPSQWQVRM
jgi:polyisoprenoid-binding protein YceI